MNAAKDVMEMKKASIRMQLDALRAYVDQNQPATWPVCGDLGQVQLLLEEVTEFLQLDAKAS